MTRFTDNLYSGVYNSVSAQSSLSPVRFCKSYLFSSTSPTTIQDVLPTGAQNIDAKLYIMAQGSTATSDKITVSGVVNGNSVNLMTFTGMGSANGVVRRSTGGLCTYAILGSATQLMSLTVETTINTTFVQTDQATEYQLQIFFTRDEAT